MSSRYSKRTRNFWPEPGTGFPEDWVAVTSTSTESGTGRPRTRETVDPRRCALRAGKYRVDQPEVGQLHVLDPGGIGKGRFYNGKDEASCGHRPGGVVRRQDWKQWKARDVTTDHGLYRVGRHDDRVGARQDGQRKEPRGKRAEYCLHAADAVWLDARYQARRRVDDLDRRVVRSDPHHRRANAVAFLVERNRDVADRVTKVDDRRLGGSDLNFDDPVGEFPGVAAGDQAKYKRRAHDTFHRDSGWEVSWRRASSACCTQRSASVPLGGRARNSRKCTDAASVSPRLRSRNASP